MLYNEAKGKKFQIETLNRYGGKFLKEVKVCGGAGIVFFGLL